MRRRCPPLWLLRDIPAFAAMMASLWALVWQMFATAFMAERRKQPASPNAIALVYGLLARAEEALDLALLRQAHRLVGFDLGRIDRTLFDPPTDLAAFNTRFNHYIHCLLNIDAVARMAAEELRRRYRLRPLRHGAARRAISPALRAREANRRVVSLRRMATGGGGLRALARMSEGAVSTHPNARGPPRTTAHCRLPIAPPAPPAGSHPLACRPDFRSTGDGVHNELLIRHSRAGAPRHPRGDARRRQGARAQLWR